MDKIQIHFTKKQLKQLKNKSDKTGISIAGLVRLAVNNFDFSKLEGGN